MTLRDTVELMESADYKERFVAEYQQLVIRYRGLRNILDKWDQGELEFTPTCPRSTYNMQIKAMPRESISGSFGRSWGCRYT